MGPTSLKPERWLEKAGDVRSTSPNMTDAGPTDRDTLGWAVAGAAAIAWFTLGYLRYRNDRAGASDLGIFDQASWLMSRGHPPFVTSIGIDVFADHVSPVLVVFAPLYRMAATPVWLLGTQALCLATTVVILRRLADELAVPRWLPTVLVVFSAPLLSAAVYDVHPVVFATPAVAWTLLASERRDLRQVSLAAVLVALCRADAVTALVGIAVVSAAPVRRRLLWLVPVPLLASILVPHWLGTWQMFDRYYPHLGSGWPDAILHPWRIVAALASTGSLRQLVDWLLPVGFLPVLRPRWMLALVIGGLRSFSLRGRASSTPGTTTVPIWCPSPLPAPSMVGGDSSPARRSWAGAGGPPPPCWRRGSSSRLPIGQPGFRVGTGHGSRWPPFCAGRPPSPVVDAIAAVHPGEGVSAQNSVLAHLGHRVDAYIWPCPFAGPPGPTTCHHRNLDRRAARVDVVVLVHTRDVDELRRMGFVHIWQHDDVTVARRRALPSISRPELPNSLRTISRNSTVGTCVRPSSSHFRER